MATVIDALIVEIGLDSTKFSKGLADALRQLAQGKNDAERHAKDLEAQIKRTTEMFGKLRTGLLGVAALFTAGLGMKEFIKQTVQTDMGVGRLAQVLDVSAKTLSTWRTAGLLAGGSGESFSTVLRTITLELAKFQLTGESQIIPMFRALGINIIDSAGKFKNATEIFLELADAIDKRHVDPARATVILQSMGADEASISAILKGRAALEAYLTQAARVGQVTNEDVKAANDLSNAWNELAQSSTSLGRSMLTGLTPALVGVMHAVAAPFQWLRSHGIAATFGERFEGATTLGGTPVTASYREPKAAFDPSSLDPSWQALMTKVHGASGAGAFTSQAEKEAFIRAEAGRRGINPDVAMAVAKSEGFSGYAGDRGSSFGAFQLHYGGVAGGGMATSGLGDKFTAQTGLDARNKDTEREQIKFALDEAQRQGWSAWHGWRGAPFAGINAGAAGAASAGAPGGGRSTSTSEVKIGTINVVTQATDAPGIARDIGDAVKNNATFANTGQW